MLRENRDVMDKLAEFLIEKETITGKEFMEIYRREKGIPEPEEKKDETTAEKKVSVEEAVVTPEPVEVPEPVKVPENAGSVQMQPAEDTGKQEENSEKPEEAPADNRPKGRFSNGRID